MKLHFDPNLAYQTDAVNAVCDLFRGQETCRTEFTVTRSTLFDEALGIGNRLSLLDDQILANLRDVQLRNGLKPTDALASGDFTVEMETGTGKTYVYLKTIYELNKRYGFTKFVIVVPSVAIKEGVYKTLQITEDHFRSLYAGTPVDAFLYDSTKLGQVRNFAASAHVQVMVVTVGAINKKAVNNLYKESEKTGGDRPIELIRQTRPIVIVDEPQSVDGGLSGAGKTALGEMSPLCTLRYSATHVDKHHMVYRLDALDAYQARLVKQIEIAGGTIEDAHNKPFVRVQSVHRTRGTITAKVELDVETATGVTRQVKVVQDGDDLEQTTGRAIYADHRIGEIRVERGNQFVELRVPGTEHFLALGQAVGDVDQAAVRKEMIRRTIREHLDKEKRLRPKGIKVLSLFFIDEVEKYRKYDADGHQVKGEYALMFEAEYQRLARTPDYRDLFQGVDLSHAAAEVHDGYFSIDKKGAWTDTDEGNQGNRDNAERAYSLIMREKERLLGLDTPLKFIFSHSALREGWDNPNVFQICALRDISTTRERRQTIGRGLRLCVNQDGQRVHGFDVNTLTVVATESYESFADNLQKEIEEDTGIRFGIVEDHQFAAVVVKDASGQAAPLGFEQSKALWDVLRAKGFIDSAGKVQDALRTALKNDAVEIPDPFKPQAPEILDILRKVAGKLEIKDANKKLQVKPNQGALKSADFKALWERIKFKTTYRVHFDNDKLIRDAATALRAAPAVPKARLQWRKAGLSIGQGGVIATPQAGSQLVSLDEHDIELPDLLTALQDKTQLTRRSILRILKDSGRLDDFKKNPQEFVEVAATHINACKRLALVAGIVYKRVGAHEFYAQELFEKDELMGYVENMLRGTQKCVFESVVYDSATERDFAQSLEDEVAVKIYTKLPRWFQIKTPLGSYNPDWAVVIEEADGDRLYFVVETKGSLIPGALRATESAKIDCGKAHFESLTAGTASPARFKLARTLAELLADG
ncbi:MAG: DEAD/DEAH box helicase family protein [Acidobacteriota bacterium]|nr:DEAD/DEAH box helicase family protein [Acidobacteriota bacterium]